MAHSKPLADTVVKGNTSLDEALAIMRQDLDRASSSEAKFERLRNDAPDLAEQVEQGEH